MQNVLKTVSKGFWLAVLLLAVPVLADVEGSADHPLLSRYPGAEIRSYFQRDYDSIFLALGPNNGRNSPTDHPEHIEVFGRITVINYRVTDAAVSLLQVYQNYAEALQKLGFTTLFNCANESCGRHFVSGLHYRISQTHSSRNLFQTYNVSGNRQEIRYWSGKVQLGQDKVHVGLTVFQRRPQDPVLVILQLAESAELVTDKIQINPEGLHQAIAQQGKVELEGILFATNEATLLPSSAEAVAIVADYLKLHPTLSFYVVGHTDSQGAFDYNLQLSAQRAATVVTTLVQQHGIAASRLMAYGAGPVSPVTSNKAEAGRAQNRRVELVLRD